MLKKIIGYILPVLIVVSGCGPSKKLAKSPVQIINGDKLYAVLLNAFYAQQDSLAMLNSDGVAFFRMEYKNNHFQNIRSAENAPPMLLRIVSKALVEQEVQLNTKSASNYYFVLPVRYYFANSSTKSLQPLLEATPKIDIDKLMGRPINWFDLFFDIETANKEVKGMPCILLPWLSIKGRVQ